MNSKEMERYLKQIKRRLNLPKEIKNRVMSDLETTIEARREQGETDASIIASLGSPAAAAAELNDQMKEYAYRKSKWRFVFLAVAILAVLWFFICTVLPAILFHSAITDSVGIIGGADGPTAILVATTPASFWNETTLSLLTVAVAILGFWKFSRCKK